MTPEGGCTAHGAGERGPGAPLAPCGHTWSAVTSRPGFMGSHTRPRGPRGLLRAVAGPRSLHAEM